MLTASQLAKVLTAILCIPLPKKKWRLFVRRFFSRFYLLEEIHRKFERSLGYSLNLQNPRTFNEKIQWYKLYYYNELFSLCSDKVRVRDYFATKSLAQFQVPLLGVWESYDQIDWQTLPAQLVFKTNHAANQIWIIRNKNSFDRKRFRKEVTEALECPFGEKGAQFHYGKIKPRILAEEYLTDDTGQLLDYKVYCFQGKAYFIQVDFDRFSNHTYALYDRNWVDTGCRTTSMNVSRPSVLEEVLSIAKILSADFPHVRVDFFIVGDKIYLGEMTFTTGSGFDSFTPEKWDLIMGECWDLDKITPDSIRQKPCLCLFDYAPNH
ncbi:ATP-grasp fold amidoligase family protein [Desulfosediminicola sp.]|uniref:ATP-grasp fold amidoligase family protein n=1 Tax=Desulfosediminicola sp. TaxID=2886825 RepID=UPI003AF21ADF